MTKLSKWPVHPAKTQISLWICVLTGHTGHFVGFVMHWLIYFHDCHNQKYHNSKWALSWENMLVLYATNKGADQPAHPRSLSSTFVGRCLDSIISLVSIFAISWLLTCFYSWAEWFESYLVKTPEDRFSHDEAQIITKCQLIRREWHEENVSFQCQQVRQERNSQKYLSHVKKLPKIFEPCHEKVCLRGLQPGKIQTSLHSYRD